MRVITELLTKMRRGLAFVATASLLLSSCSERRAPGERRSDEAAASASFVDKVWKVRESSGVAPGTLSVFLSEGTLVITAPNSKPALGTWKYQGGALTMVEEGIPYKVDILKLNEDEFRIRSNNPGEPVEITLVPGGVPSPNKR